MEQTERAYPSLTDGEKEFLLHETWSYSRLTTFQTCPATFYRRYILRDFRQADNTIFGTAIHEYVENYAKGKELTYIDIVGKYPEIRRRVKSLDKAFANLKFFCDCEIKDNSRLIENDFHFTIGGKYKFIIKTDCVLFKGNNIEVYDYKSSKSSDFWKSYEKQMRYYKFFIEKKFPGKMVNTFLYYPMPNDLIKIDVKTDGVEQEIIDLIEKILNSKEFPETKHQFCDWCDYNTDCIIYSQGGEK